MCDCDFVVAAMCKLSAHLLLSRNKTVIAAPATLNSYANPIEIPLYILIGVFCPLIKFCLWLR